MSRKTTRKSSTRRRTLSRDEMVTRCTAAMNFALFKALPDVPDYTRESWLRDAAESLDILLVTRGNAETMIQAWRLAADCFNIAEQLAMDGLTSGLEYIQPAQDALAAKYRRAVAAQYADSGWTLTGEQIKALRLGLEAFSIQLEDAAITGKEWADMTRRSAERCRNARKHAKDGEIWQDVMVVTFPNTEMAEAKHWCAPILHTRH